jgi:hypothetical protein
VELAKGETIMKTVAVVNNKVGVGKTTSTLAVNNNRKERP